MTGPYAFDNQELLRVAKDVADQKGLNVDVVIKAMEDAVQAASYRKYGHSKIKAVIDRKTGGLALYRQLMVTHDGMAVAQAYDEQSDEDVDYDFLSLNSAKLIKEDAQVGDIVLEPLPVEFDHNAARAARRKVFQVIREEERKKQYSEYITRVGEVVYGTVKRVEYRSVIVDLNGYEGYLPFASLIRGETFRQGDKIKAYIEEVKRAEFGPQIFLSRTHKGFMEQLFKHEVPEVYDGIVTIKAIARDPGSRSKIAVFSSDKNIDPIGACVGMRGSRIRGIVSELNDEKIDVVMYSQDLGKFVISAIAPAEVQKVIIDEDEHKVELVVLESQLSLAIGRRGQNVRLASELIGWRIDILSDVAEATRRSEELNFGTKLFVKALDVEEIIGNLLVSEGFVSVDDVAEASVDELSRISGFNEEIAVELKSRAVEYLTNSKNLEEKEGGEKESADANSIGALPFLKAEDIALLARKGVKNMLDIADLSRDELYELLDNNAPLGEQQIDAVIMEARKKLGWLSE